MWSLLEPLLTTAVLTIVFGTLFANKDPKFPVYILSGRLIYSFFSQGTTSALKSIRANSSLIKKVYVPKLLYPLSCILFNYIIFLISLIVMGLLCVIFKVTPTWHIVEALIPLFNLLLITTGCGLILSTVGVFFRDMEYLWTVLRCWLCMHQQFSISQKDFNSGYGFILKLNPLYCVISISVSVSFMERAHTSMCTLSMPSFSESFLSQLASGHLKRMKISSFLTFNYIIV